ncbi:MAG TPA: HAMP domain-containing histidine kinase [Arcobacter sp.]|nr:HAMP domain-containing histidine kinase [Arcobacter sp.]
MSIVNLFNNLTIKKKLILFSFTVVLFAVVIATYIYNSSVQATLSLKSIKQYQLNLIFFAQNIKSKISNVESLIVQQSLLKATNKEFSFQDTKKELDIISKELNKLEAFAKTKKDKKLIEVAKTISLHYLLYSLASFDFFFEDFSKENSEVFYTALNEVINSANSINLELTKLTRYSRESLDNSIYKLHSDIIKNDMTIRYIGGTLLILILLFLLMFSKELVNQISVLTKGMEEFKKGNLSYRIHNKYKNDLSILGESLNNMAHSLNNSNKEKEDNHHLLVQSSKMAAMGEMIGNIAHQWRQPLSLISTVTSSMLVQKEIGILKDTDFYDNSEKILSTVSHLSQTIEDFRNFFKESKDTIDFGVNEVINKNLILIGSTLDSNNIKLHKEFQNEIKTHGLENELTQSILNILNNAKDALLAKEDLKEKLIFINTSTQTIGDKEFARIEIIDNAGGVPNKIINNIFEPYFTTKHQSQGTGIGLFMTRQIIVGNMHGYLDVENISYTHEQQHYTGAQFTINIPIL